MEDNNTTTTTEKTTSRIGPVRAQHAGGRTLKGKVVSTKMQDTATVAVERYVKHAKYKKYQRRTKKYLVHDRGNTARVGDKVEICEVKPISKRKRFILVSSE